MKNECNIIQDILPLYVENMVSADTGAFVEEHLARCAGCSKEFDNMKKPSRLEQAADNGEYGGAMPLRSIKKRLNKNKSITICITVIVTALTVLLGAYLLGSGFNEQTDVMLLDYSLAADGASITLKTGVAASLGYVRGFKDNGGGVKPHYLVFYGTFGGLNSTYGAKNEFELALDAEDTEIFFNRAGGGYELVLQKDAASGEWRRPNK